MVDQNPGNTLPPLPSRLQLSPEFRLLLASTWIAPAGYVQHQADQIEATCRGDINWDLFLSLVARHRVLVPHDVLRRQLGSRLPDRVYEHLTARRIKACRASLRHSVEMVRCIKAFDAQGVDVLALKGIMLSMQLYGDHTMRITRDLDLLVRPECLEAGDRILQEQGYKRTFPDFELTPRRQKWVLQNGHHYCYYTADRQQLIELHWRLAQWRTEHVAELWNNCRRASWLGASFLNMNDDALLLFLCDHGAKHRWTRIKWLNDVASLIAQDRSFSWPNARAMADRFDLSLPLAQAGILVNWIYKIPLPAPLIDLTARESRAVSLAAQAVDAMLLSEDGQFTRIENVKGVVYSTRIRKKRLRAASLRSCMLSTDEFKEFPLPDRLFWLYFPLRPLLWFYHHYIKSGA
jgi:hypothetical protein